MKVLETAIPGVYIIETDVFGDHRGFFTETYNKPKYEAQGIYADFVQDNMSFSACRGTLRGLHWQNPPFAQAKLISCSNGAVLDVAVDIRRGSPTFGKYVSTEISAENHRQLYLPRGFAHGFLTLTDNVVFRYKCDNVYNKSAEAGMRYDTPEVAVDWKELGKGVVPILSEKDLEAPYLSEADIGFIYKVNC